MIKILTKINRRYLLLSMAGVVFIVAAIVYLVVLSQQKEMTSKDSQDNSSSEALDNQVDEIVDETSFFEDSPESMLAQGRVDEAQAAYSEMIAQVDNNKDKADIYRKQSRACIEVLDVKCALEAWYRYGDLIEKDYTYYLSLANLLNLSGDKISARENLNKAESLMSNAGHVDNVYTEQLKNIESQVNIHD